MIREERAKEKRKKKRRKRAAILIPTILVILVAAFLIVWKVFTVKTVIVEGNDLYEDERIKETVLNDEYSWNSLYVLLKYKFTKMEPVPFIDQMSVSLKGPHTVCIDVYEKGIIGYLYDSTLNENVYFDKDGFVVETSDRIIENIPEIKGLTCKDVVLYENLSIKKKTLSEMLTLTVTLKRSNLIPDSIIYGGTNSPILVYDNVWVQMGSIDLLTPKVERLAEILPKLSGESGVLHLEAWTEDSTGIVFDRDEN